MQNLTHAEIEQVAGAGLNNAEMLQHQQQAAAGAGTPAGFVAAVFQAQAILTTPAERVPMNYRPPV